MIRAAVEAAAVELIAMPAATAIVTVTVTVMAAMERCVCAVEDVL
jgi:hypothetical protein